MEIHSAVGGKESMLFAHEVFLMYRNLAYNNGWDFNDTDYSSDEKGRNNYITQVMEHTNYNIYITVIFF
jgi:protein subunit release factor A